METKLIIKYSLIAAIVVFYLVYTFRYALVFRKNNFFNGRRKLFHSVLIWLFPFVWILLLKSILKPIPGSYAFKKRKVAGGFTESGIGILGFWGLSELGRPHDGDDSGHDSGGDGGGGGDGGED